MGHPDPDTFDAARELLAELHDELWRAHGPEPAQTVLGGFSMGTVMSYALAFDAARPAPAGVLAFSGFIPDVEGWQPELASRTQVRVLIAHGRHDQVIDVAFARDAHERLRDAGLAVEYHESDAAHHIDPRQIPPQASGCGPRSRRNRQCPRRATPRRRRARPTGPRSSQKRIRLTTAVHTVDLG